jgi:membrane protease YdiL (CAAX protease family)
MNEEGAISPREDDSAPVAEEREDSGLAVPAAETSEAPRDAATEELFPLRYVAYDNGEKGRYLCCVESPEVQVIFSSSTAANEATARKAPSGTIFVDGAALAPPFIDAERDVYNLDHHTGCVRQFTVSACEQALILVLRGLDLSARPWTIHATQPDLDAVLAIWVLLNAARIQAMEREERSRLVALVRLESVIDVHGLASEELSGLGPTELGTAKSGMERLRRRELELKKSGAWDGVDMPEHVADVLREIDIFIFPAGSLPEPVPFEVLARATVRDALILVCSADQGIYEVEAGMKQAYGKRLAILALKTGTGRYTLRLVNPFHGRNLHAIYNELNALDPAVVRGGWRDSWGGSGEIGGSPRESGTALEPGEIAAACKKALRGRSLAQKTAALGAAFALTAFVLLIGKLAGWLATGSAMPLLTAKENFPFAFGFGLTSAVLLVASNFWRPRAFGLQRLVMGSWLYLVPVAVLAALAGGVWRVVPAEGLSAGSHVSALVLLAAGTEFLFRGVAHGVLGQGFQVAHAGGRWLISVPATVSALMYAGASLLLPLAGSPFAVGGPTAQWVTMVTACLLFGLTVGVVRERSGSILAPILLHSGGVALCELVVRWLAAA